MTYQTSVRPVSQPASRAWSAGGPSRRQPAATTPAIPAVVPAGGRLSAGVSAGVSAGGRSLASYPAVATARPTDAAAVARMLALATLAGVVVWSLSYLARQSGLDLGAQPFSPLGDFAIEGACLALAWLSLVLAACFAVLRGTIVVVDK